MSRWLGDLSRSAPLANEDAVRAAVPLPGLEVLGTGLTRCGYADRQPVPLELVPTLRLLHLQEVHELQCEGTSNASPQVASVSSDRSKQCG
jgi:hypothetical protein